MYVRYAEQKNTFSSRFLTQKNQSQSPPRISDKLDREIGLWSHTNTRHKTQSEECGGCAFLSFVPSGKYHGNFEERHSQARPMNQQRSWSALRVVLETLGRVAPGKWDSPRQAQNPEHRGWHPLRMNRWLLDLLSLARVLAIVGPIPARKWIGSCRRDLESRQAAFLAGVLCLVSGKTCQEELHVFFRFCCAFAFLRKLFEKLTLILRKISDKRSPIQRSVAIHASRFASGWFKIDPKIALIVGDRDRLSSAWGTLLRRC